MDALPLGFPQRLEGPMAWDGKEFQDKPELYVEALSKQDISEIDQAIAHFKGLDIPRGFVSRETFPLSQAFSERLRKINNILNDGRGFHVLRGIVPSRYGEEDHVILFAGLASHVASNRASNIAHIVHDRKSEALGENLRPPELSVAMDFHTDADAGNILALFTERRAKSGGEQYLSSFWRVYNDLARDRPDVLHELAKDWHWEKPRGQQAAGLIDILRRAIIGESEGRLEINFGRTFVAGHPNYPLSDAAPPLTGSQEEALFILRDVARKYGFQLDLQVGDILFVNNLSIMHARNAFMDDAEQDNSRHLLRLWLWDPKTSWPIAPSLKYMYDNMENVGPDLQKLRSVSEWDALPREIRVAEASLRLADHD